MRVQNVVTNCLAVPRNMHILVHGQRSQIPYIATVSLNTEKDIMCLKSDAESVTMGLGMSF